MNINNSNINSSKEENLKVFVRCRPTSPIDESVSTTTKTISINRDDKKSTTNFSFNRVLTLESSQSDVYKACCDNILNDVIQGINLTILAYGQTGSCKTYSMLGKGWDDVKNIMSSSLNSSITSCLESFSTLKVIF